VNEIDEIRWQMAQIRHDLHHDVASVVSGVSGVVDEVAEVMTGSQFSATTRTSPPVLPWRSDA
jgi:hypothetical protein